MIVLTIEDKATMNEFVTEAKKANLLKGVDIRSIPEEEFPIRIPVKLDSFIKVAGNPLFKPIRKKVESTVLQAIEAMI